MRTTIDLSESADDVKKGKKDYQIFEKDSYIKGVSRQSMWYVFNFKMVFCMKMSFSGALIKKNNVRVRVFGHNKKLPN